VSDRNGHAEARAGIEENLRFLGQHRAHAHIRGVFGLHASFTLRDETLDEVTRRRPEGSGCHIHVAEDPLDVEASRRAFGAGPVERLERFRLLDAHTLLAHGIHLPAEDYARIGRRNGVLIHNPESNANNGVGRLDVANAAKQGCLVGLGTDGMGSAMLRALRAAHLTQRAGAKSPDEMLPDLLWNNVSVARRFFEEPLLGELSPGAPADIAVIDAAAPTPIASKNLAGHLIYGASEAPVRHTIARGRILLEDFAHKTLDPAELGARARELSPALWERFHALKWGTNFLG
jgi:cytosine/adenosine deaminase-related metal-dependent hydrolase